MYWIKEVFHDRLDWFRILIVFACIFCQAPFYFPFLAVAVQMLFSLCCLPWRKEARKWKEIEGSYSQ